jgi:hypothetical protein
MELWKQAAELGSSLAHFQLGTQYDAKGNSKKEKFHYEAAAWLVRKVQDATLNTPRHSLETWDEL